MRSCLLLVVLLLTQASFADTKLYLEDFTIASGETKEVSLILENDAPATALQVSIDLPTELSYIENSVQKTDRVKGRGAVVQASASTGKLVIVETDGTIAAGEGAIITFKVQAGDDLDGGTKPVELSNIIVSDANGDQLNENESYTATAKYLGLDCKFTAPESLEVSVGKEYQVDVTMTNVQSLTAFQGTLTLPEGLEIVVPDTDEPSELFIYSDRIPMTNQFKFQKGESSISFVLSSTMNSEIVGNDGVIFSFKVKATEVLAEESEISLTNMYVARTTGKSQLCDPVTISVKNTSVADEAAFTEYKAEQTAALEALAEEGDSEEAQAIIAAAVEAINALNFDYALTLDENKAAVDELVAPVAEALEAQRAAEALAADKAAFDEFKAEQIADVEALAAEGDSEASQQIIAEAVAAIEALEYDEEKTLDENEAAVAELVAPVAEALDAQRAAEALAADKAAFDEFKAEQIAAVEALAAEGDSEASQQIIAEAVAAIEALEYDEEKTLDENKAAVDELVAPVAEALDAQRAAEALAADKAAFAEYQAEQIAAIESLAEEGDSEASQQIIAEAIAAIEALEYDEEKTLDENKAAVDEVVAPVAEALDAQRAAEALAADKAAFDEFKAEQIAAVEALAAEGDSEASQQIIAEAVAAIEALEYDEAKTLEENEAAVAELVAPVAEALEAQRTADAAAAAEQLAADKAAFDTYKAEQTAAVEALAEEGDSEASQQIIAKAVAAIEALEYDEEKTLDENKAAVDAAVAPVAEALAEQRAADEAAAKAAANEAAYTTLKAQYDELRAALRQAKNTIKSDYADVASQFDDAIADIEDMLSDAIAKLEGEYAAGKLTAESQLQNGEAIAAGIEKLLADAAAAQLAAYKAAFNTYKAEQTAAVETLAEDGDSEASQQIIANAVAAIEALEYDEALTLDENKAAVDAVVAPVADALAEQRAADAIIPGDTNGDGEVNTVDASYILMYLVGNVPADFVEAAADVDGNGRIDTLDATAILKKLVE